MGRRGPIPKDPEKRARRNATIEMTTLGTVAVKNAPKLPTGKKYLKATKDWFETWRRSPQASQFSKTDWQRLIMLAPLIDLYFRAPTKELFAEIRKTEADLGATVADRQRLRWVIPAGTVSAPPTEEPTAPKPRTRRKPDPRANLRLVANA